MQRAVEVGRRRRRTQRTGDIERALRAKCGCVRVQAYIIRIYIMHIIINHHIRLATRVGDHMRVCMNGMSQVSRMVYDMFYMGAGLRVHCFGMASMLACKRHCKR